MCLDILRIQHYLYLFSSPERKTPNCAKQRKKAKYPGGARIKGVENFRQYDEG